MEPEDLAAEAQEARGGSERRPPPSAEVTALALEWLAARRARDYGTADRIRTDLRARGVEAAEVAESAEALSWASWEEQPKPAGGNDPTAASASASSSLGQLLVMDYNVIAPLPADLRMTVCITCCMAQGIS